METPILITEDCWKNCQLSISRFYGGCKLNGKNYVLINTDLVVDKFIPYYKKMKRDKFVQVLKEHPNDDEKTLFKVFKEATKKPKEKEELKLF